MLDVKDFYLNTPMKRHEYIRIKITDIPNEVIEHYKLREIVTEDGYVCCEIRKGKYGFANGQHNYQKPGFYEKRSDCQMKLGAMGLHHGQKPEARKKMSKNSEELVAQGKHNFVTDHPAKKRLMKLFNESKLTHY
jgi:hypothetical protein